MFNQRPWDMRFASVIDEIPTFDQNKLSAIEVNANRLVSVGSEAQKAHAESVSPARHIA